MYNKRIWSNFIKNFLSKKNNCLRNVFIQNLVCKSWLPHSSIHFPPPTILSSSSYFIPLISFFTTLHFLTLPPPFLSLHLSLPLPSPSLSLSHHFFSVFLLFPFFLF